MFPTFLIEVAPYVAGLRILVATLPSGEVERTVFAEVPEGMRALVERRSARSDVATRRQVLVPRGSYQWQVLEERRSVLMAVPGRPTGVVRRAFTLILFSDRRDARSVMPSPVESYRFHAPTREAAEALRERMKAALKDDAPKPTRRWGDDPLLPKRPLKIP